MSEDKPKRAPRAKKLSVPKEPIVAEVEEVLAPKPKPEPTVKLASVVKLVDELCKRCKSGERLGLGEMVRLKKAVEGLG